MGRSRRSDHPLLSRLTGGDRRSTGASDAVALDVLNHPEWVSILVDGLSADDPRVRMRAADALQKVATSRAEVLSAHVPRLLGRSAESTEQEVCWHLAQMMPLIPLSAARLRRMRELLSRYLKHESRIVRTEALTAWVHLARKAPTLRAAARRHLRRAFEDGSAAERARARRLRAENADWLGPSAV